MTKSRFREILYELRVTQKDLAYILSVDPRTVRRWTSNDGTKIPGPVAKCLIAWDTLNRLGLHWRPDAIDILENDDGIRKIIKNFIHKK